MDLQNNLLFISLKRYYTGNNLKLLLKYLKRDKISLRIVDWFVTNYSKKYDSIYDNNNKPFIVFHSYKSQLKSYSKRYFDPFCRRNRIDFYYRPNESISTTIGQLNFFRWAINNNVIEYIIENYEKIETDMNISIRDMKKNFIKQKNCRKKRQELSLSASRGLNKHHGRIVISFD